MTEVLAVPSGGAFDLLALGGLVMRIDTGRFRFASATPERWG
jgi:hypothetical protein